jgi:two-component system, OmpR family, sensor kinase
LSEHSQPDRLLPLIQQLLAIEETDIPKALNRAATLVVEAFAAEKADIFLYEQESQTLVALGVSQTLLGQHQRSIGMNRLPLANGGRTVEVFQTGTPYRSGHVDQDPKELPGIKEALGIRSVLLVPLMIGDERRGVIQVDMTQPDFFTQHDQDFLEGVAHWVGTVAHRAELFQQVAQAAAEEARRGTAEALVTVLAHDLRNYLTPLQGRVGLLTRRAKKEQRQRDLDDLAGIAATMGRLERLITDLMDTARLSQGLFTLTKQPIDLVALVEETATMLSTPSIPIEVHLPTECIAWVDADRFRQALENVLSNAVKHSPNGTIVLVQAERQEEEAELVLSVSDQGPGIPEELSATLFEPFRAGSGSMGLGLGLYLARQIALAHGGQLSVDRTYHDGARFLLRLPLHEVS